MHGMASSVLCRVTRTATAAELASKCRQAPRGGPVYWIGYFLDNGMHQIAIGCAGWSIPRHYRELFETGESMLARYASRFSVTEINSSFYRSHQRTTYERWAAAVPGRFRFSAKIPKLISHEMALRGCGPALDGFLDEVSGLGGKLQGLLLQLPPSHRFDMRVASTFFRVLRRRTTLPVACEPRHPSWSAAQATMLFQDVEVSLVTADPAILRAPDLAASNRPWPYWRLHGTPRMYYSDYSEAALNDVARNVGALRSSLIAPWVVFDNTANGFAVGNAARLQEMTRPKQRSARAGSKNA